MAASEASKPTTRCAGTRSPNPQSSAGPRGPSIDKGEQNTRTEHRPQQAAHPRVSAALRACITAWRLRSAIAVWAGCVRFSDPCAAAKPPRRRRRCGPAGVETSSERPASPGHTDWTTAVSITSTRAAALPAAASAWDRAAARQLWRAPWRGDRGGEAGRPASAAVPVPLAGPSRAQWAPARTTGARVTTRKRATGRRPLAVVHHPDNGDYLRTHLRPGSVTERDRRFSPACRPIAESARNGVTAD
jgi:hypothetical protein